MGDVVITFSFSDVLWICGAICTIAAAVAVIAKAFSKAAMPENVQNQRLDALEEQAREFAKYFDRDKTRLDQVDESNRITQEALLALLSHAINGNDVDGLVKAKKDLQAFLIKGGVNHD